MQTRIYPKFEKPKMEYPETGYGSRSSRFLPAIWQQPSERLPEENAETFRQTRHAKKEICRTLYT